MPLFGDFPMLRLRKQNHTGEAKDVAFSCKMPLFKKMGLFLKKAPFGKSQM
jgi:hypothetical protein